MEPVLRGVLEKHIDGMLKEESLIQNLTLMKRYKENGIIDSITSAMFGLIFNSSMHIVNYYYHMANEDINEEIIEELLGIIDSRALQIKSRINEIANL